MHGQVVSTCNVGFFLLQVPARDGPRRSRRHRASLPDLLRAVVEGCRGFGGRKPCRGESTKCRVAYNRNTGEAFVGSR